MFGRSAWQIITTELGLAIWRTFLEIASCHFGLFMQIVSSVGASNYVHLEILKHVIVEPTGAKPSKFIAVLLSIFFNLKYSL